MILNALQAEINTVDDVKNNGNINDREREYLEDLEDQKKMFINAIESNRFYPELITDMWRSLKEELSNE